MVTAAPNLGVTLARLAWEVEMSSLARPEGIEPPALGFEVLDETSHSVANDSKPLQIQQVTADDVSRASPETAPNGKDFGALVVQENPEAEGVGSGAPKAIGPFLTVREVAARLRVCTATVYDLCDSGRLAHVRVNNAIRVGAEALREYLREGGQRYGDAGPAGPGRGRRR